MYTGATAVVAPEALLGPADAGGPGEIAPGASEFPTVSSVGSAGVADPADVTGVAAWAGANASPLSTTTTVRAAIERPRQFARDSDDEMDR